MTADFFFLDRYHFSDTVSGIYRFVSDLERIHSGVLLLRPIFSATQRPVVFAAFWEAAASLRPHTSADGLRHGFFGTKCVSGPISRPEKQGNHNKPAVFRDFFWSRGGFDCVDALDSEICAPYTYQSVNWRFRYRGR